jgi:hypothetical protein
MSGIDTVQMIDRWNGLSTIGKDHDEIPDTTLPS